MYKRKYIRLKRTEKQQKPAFWITARCYKGSDSFLVRVPGVMTSVPEVPEVVLVDDFVYRLTQTNPLEYANVLSAIARRVK